MDKNPKWEPVDNVDYSRRSPDEWAKIYGVELLDNLNDGRVWSEYEWGYHFVNSDYKPLYIPGKEYDFERLSEMELRAIELRRDIFLGATREEKKMLNERYVDTEWCRRRLLTI